MPSIESVFQYLSKAKLFTMFDLVSDYIPLEEPYKPSLIRQLRIQLLLQLPFQLTIGSSILTSVLDKVFGDII